MVQPSKKNRRPSERRDAILCCALKHFAKRGFRDADLDSVARELGCAKGTLYNYFETKEDLFRAAADRVMGELFERTSASKASDPLERIEHGIRAYLAFFDDHPEYVELLIQERAEMRGESRSVYFVHRDERRPEWRAMMRQLMDEGRVRRGPVERALETLGNLLYGTITANVMSGRPKSLRAAADGVVEVVFCGLLTPEECSRRARKSVAKRGVRGVSNGRSGGTGSRRPRLASTGGDSRHA